MKKKQQAAEKVIPCNVSENGEHNFCQAQTSATWEVTLFCTRCGIFVTHRA